MTDNETPAPRPRAARRPARVPPWTTHAPSSEVRVPTPLGSSRRARWSLKDLEKVPDDGEWWGLCEYGPSTGYQVARQCNGMARLEPGMWEFGVRALDVEAKTTELVVRRLRPAG